MLSWTSEGVNNDLIPGPGLALDPKDPSTHVPDDFYSVGEFKVFVTLDAKRTQECRDKVLDYRERRLVLLYLDEVL